MATKKSKSSAGKSSAKGKKKGSGKKKKGDMSAKKKKDIDELGMQLLQHSLRSLREDYQSNCKHFITEPIPSLTKTIDRACSSLEHVDKIILNSTRLTFNDVYSITRTFMRYDALNFICLWMAKMDVKGVDALVKD
jgi:hypothetical protein